MLNPSEKGEAYFFGTEDYMSVTSTSATLGTVIG
jgi:hypothetical protein